MDTALSRPATFAEYSYLRPDMPAFTADFERLLRAFDAADQPDRQLAALDAIEALRSSFLSMRSLASIRHTMDTADTFYEEEKAFFDVQSPHFQALGHRFYTSLLKARFREAIETRWGNQLFRLAEMSLRTFRPEILEDLQEENRLSSAYTKIKAKAVIPFRGEEYNLAAIRKWEEHPDRAIRREAAFAKWSFFAEQAEALDDLYDQLVRVRDRMARRLGFSHFTPLAYERLSRSGYGPEQVTAFRQAVATHVVPVASWLYERQRERLGLEDLRFYDEPFRFPSGNPTPKGDPGWIMERARRMYTTLSPETNAFFRHQSENGLMDLETRPGKATGGYCTFISDHKAPFVFSNFNGTSGDVDVLTHEAGHAFQIYCSRHLGLQEYYWPTLEACEIHSMSMEFFTWPWMELFFGEEAEKYRYQHLAGGLTFMPYGVAVDAFQQFVYENPAASPEERNRAWRDLEKRFLPHRDYQGHPHLESGRFWHRQNHIFVAPFYYIDYVLAQVCALQFWQRDRRDHRSAWDDYVNLCRQGGSQAFLDLVRLAGLSSPFDPSILPRLMGETQSFLRDMDDKAW